jgi:hypothetical protein
MMKFCLFRVVNDVFLGVEEGRVIELATRESGA